MGASRHPESCNARGSSNGGALVASTNSVTADGKDPARNITLLYARYTIGHVAWSLICVYIYIDTLCMHTYIHTYIHTQSTI